MPYYVDTKPESVDTDASPNAGQTVDADNGMQFCAETTVAVDARAASSRRHFIMQEGNCRAALL